MTATERWREAASAASHLYRASDARFVTHGYWNLVAAAEILRGLGEVDLAERVDELGDGFSYDEADLAALRDDVARLVGRYETLMLEIGE